MSDEKREEQEVERAPEEGKAEDVIAAQTEEQAEDMSQADETDAAESDEEFAAETVEQDVQPAPEAMRSDMPQAAPRAGVGPMVLAGALTAALGFGGAWFWQERAKTALAEDLAAQQAALTNLTARLDALKIPDLAPLSGEIGAVSAALNEQSGALEALGMATDQRFAALREQLAATELVASGGQADASTAGRYIREVEARLGQLESNAASITQASDVLRAEADAAEAAARLAQARASLSEIGTALTTGAPFAAPLAALGNYTEAPAALSNVAQDGVTPLAALREEWPGLARATLAQERSGAESGGSLGSLFAKQFNLRSTTPREGDSTDAVLSRAEAALRGDDLSSALAELAALPQTAQDALGDWIDRASAANAARKAVIELTQQLNEK